MGGLLKEFTIDQLAGSVALILGSLGGLLLIIWKSRCKKINCCYLLRCERQIDNVEEQEEDNEQNDITDTELNRKLNKNIMLRQKLERMALDKGIPNESEPEPEPESKP